ncbi:MAG: hypothetical protein ABEN55_06970, partial [Bradymonadaceae bacterium]
ADSGATAPEAEPGAANDEVDQSATADDEPTAVYDDELAAEEELTDEGAKFAEDEFADDGEHVVEGEQFDGAQQSADEGRDRLETPTAGHDLPAEQLEDGEIPDDAPSDAWESEHADEAYDAASSQTSPAVYEEADVSPEDIADEDISAVLYDEEPDDAGDGTLDAAEDETLDAEDEALDAEDESFDAEKETLDAAEDESLDAEDETLDAEESDPDEIILEDELESILNPAEPESVDAEPLPKVGPYLDPATLTLWIAGEEHETFAVAQDQLVIGAGPDEADEEAAPTVDIDLGPYLDGTDVWQRHAEVFRHNKNYTLCVTSDGGGTQVNDNLMEL